MPRLARDMPTCSSWSSNSAFVSRAGGRSACSCRRRRSRRSATRHERPSEVALALAVFHRCFGEPVVGARRAALGDRRGGDLGITPQASPPSNAPRRCTVMSPTVRNRTSLDRVSPSGRRGRRRRASRRARTPRAGARSRSTAARSPRARCTRHTSSSVQFDSGNTRRCSPRRTRRCTASTARVAGCSGPTGRTRRGTRRCAPWRARGPRRGAHRRTRRRSRAPRSRRAAWSSAAGCATRAARFSAHAAVVDRVLDARDDQPLAELGDAAVAELEHLGEVVSGVDVHQREREARRPERLLGEAQQHDRVLAAGEQQHRPLALGGDLAHDVDGLVFERVEVGQREAGACSPHSVFSSPAQRPSRPVARERCSACSRSTSSPGRAAGCRAGRGSAM